MSAIQTAFDSIWLSFQLHANFHKEWVCSIMHGNKAKIRFCKWHNKSALLLSRTEYIYIYILLFFLSSYFSCLHFPFFSYCFASNSPVPFYIQNTMGFVLRLLPTSIWHKYTTWNVRTPHKSLAVPKMCSVENNSDASQFAYSRIQHPEYCAFQ